MTIGYVCLALAAIIFLALGIDYWIRMRRAATSVSNIRINTSGFNPARMTCEPKYQQEEVIVRKRKHFDYERDNRYGQ